MVGRTEKRRRHHEQETRWCARQGPAVANDTPEELKIVGSHYSIQTPCRRDRGS
jgi:hypothetical protein